MKKLLLSAFTLLFGLTSQAQYTITEAQAPLAGEVNFTYTDSLPYRDDSAQVDKGMAGADQVWDIVDVDLDFENNTAYENPNDVTAYASEYPEAELAFSFQGLGWGLIDVSSTGMEWIAVTIEENGFVPPGHKRFDDPETQAVFPSTFETTYDDESSLRYSFEFDTTFSGFDIDSARINYSSSRSVVFDGSGQLSTLYGTFDNVLRSRSEITVSNEIDVCVKTIPVLPCTWVPVGAVFPGFSGGEQTNVVYNWYNEQSKFPLATLTYNETDDTLQVATINTDDALLSVATVKEGAKLNIYPNPASEVLYFSNASAINRFALVDLTGKVVSNAIPANGKVDLTAFENGIYIVVVETANGTKLTERLVISH